MYMIIKDLEYDREDSYEVDVVHRPDELARAGPVDDDTDYPLKFKLSSKHFGSLISNIRKLSSVITLQKSGPGPIQFTFAKAQKVTWTGIYNDSKKIELKSELSDDEIFSVSVTIEYIYPFSASKIGEEVYIAAHESNRISFTSYLDKCEHGYACSVKIFTDIVTHRRAPKPAK
jgi:hypothetical protein